MADRYMIATVAHHKLGDISRDNPDLAIVYDETDADFIGEWATGIGFVNVRFPKATTRELTENERERYGRAFLVTGDRVTPIRLDDDPRKDWPYVGETP